MTITAKGPTIGGRDHREVLRKIPPRRKTDSLQIYFW
jgi:hypothetical protein